MSYELVPLGELGEIVAGSTPDTNNQKYWGGDIAWITPADLTSHEGIYFTGELRTITEAGYKSCSTKMLPAGSILFSSRAPIGHCAVTSFPLCTNQGFKSIIPNEKLDAVYGFFALKFFTPQIEALGRGATFAEVNKEIFENIKIPLPPLTEQKRIASLLARADRLRQLRRTAHDLGDALLQSVFLEMSEKARGKMKEVRLETLADVKTGGTPSREVPEYFNGQIPWVKTTEVVNEVIYETSEKISEAGLKASNCEVFPVGTILIAMYGQGLTRGRTGKLGIPATTNQACAAILPSSKINTDYLWTFLKLSYNKIRDLGRGGNQPNLNLSMVRDLVIPVPPLSLQEEFAGVVARVESLRGQMWESARQVEGLFESLLAEAFNA